MERANMGFISLVKALKVALVLRSLAYHRRRTRLRGGARVGDCTISIGESVWEERKFRERKFRGNEALSGLGILGLGFGVYYLGFGLVLRFVLELR